MMYTLFLPTTAYAKPADLSQEYAFGPINSLGEGLTTLVRVGFEIGTTVVVIYFLIAAYQIITSAGDKNALAGAQSRMTHSIIGIILLVMLFSILQFIPSFFGIENFKLIEGGP